MPERKRQATGSRGKRQAGERKGSKGREVLIEDELIDYQCDWKEGRLGGEGQGGRASGAWGWKGGAGS